MVANKTKPTAIGVQEFIDALPDASKRTDAQKLVEVMQGLTGEEPKMWGPSIIGFGTVHYRYESGHEGDMPLACFSPRKGAIVLYSLLGSSDSAELLAKLGKYTSGKGCLYIKKLSDVDMGILEKLIIQSVATRRNL